MTKALLLPVSLFFFYTAFVFVTSPGLFQPALTKAVDNFPSFLNAPFSAFIKNTNLVQALGLGLGLIGVLVIKSSAKLLKTISLVFIGLIAVIIGGIITNKLEMQQLSEALERVAYLSALTGMLFVASSTNQQVQGADKKKED